MSLPIRTLAASAVAASLLAPAAEASQRKSIVEQAVEAYQSANSYTVPAAGTVEVAFGSTLRCVQPVLV